MMDEPRHLDMSELLALRDGGGTVFARGHLEECEACRGELERLHRLRAELQALPELEPPRDLWPRVAKALERRKVRRGLAFGATGLAAAAALTALIMIGSHEAEGPAAAGRSGWVAEAASDDLGPYISRSRQLESMRRAYSPASLVYDAPTALAVSVLEDRIVLLDRMLEESRAIGADRRMLAGLWDERVGTLETLVEVELGERPERVWR